MTSRSTETNDRKRQGMLTRARHAIDKDFAGFMAMELFGTIVYVLIGTSGEGLSNIVDSSGGRSTLPGFISFFIWGLALAGGIYISGGYSGGQLNGSVTVGLAIVRKLTRHKILIYFMAQIWGGIIGSGLAAGLYHPAVQAGYVLSPIPRQGFPVYHMFLSPFLSTFCFLLILSGICDVKNMRIPRAMLGLCIGSTYALVSIVFSYCWSGATIMNPTADMGMRIMNAFFGNNVFWKDAMIAYFGSFLGAACGAALYTFAIQYHWDTLPVKPPAPTGRITFSFQPTLKTYNN